MNEDVTFLVSSCDKYEDAWEPFFRLFHIMGADQATSNPAILNTESKQYTCDFMQVRTINTPGKMTWSERMKSVLEQIESDYIFLLLEDFFIQSPFNLEYFNILMDYFRKHPEVGVIHTTPNSRFKEIPDEMFFERTFEDLNITVTAVIWRKDYLLKLLRKHESIWDFEWYVGKRAKHYPERVMQYSEKFPRIYDYEIALNEGYGISQGKWLPKNKALFEKYGISVNFDNLGYSETDYESLGWKFLPDNNNNPYHSSKTPWGFAMRILYHYKNKIKARKSLK